MYDYTQTSSTELTHPILTLPLLSNVPHPLFMGDKSVIVEVDIAEHRVSTVGVFTTVLCTSWTMFDIGVT